MARRRYISTTISKDKVVNRLAMEQGDFAALLYTWMVPHAEDDGTLTCDAEELLYEVMPARRDKSVADVETALGAMLALGLIEQVGEHRLGFPYESFYRYQTYIRDDRRRSADGSPVIDEDDTTPHISDERREAAQITTSVNHSHSVSSSPSPSVSVTPETRAPARETPPPKSSPAAIETAEILVTAPWVGDDATAVALAVERSFQLVPEFNPRDGPLLAEQFVRWKGYRKKPPLDWFAAWLNWLRKERDRGREQTIGPNGAAAHSGRGLRRYDDPSVVPITEGYIRHRIRPQPAAG